MERQICPRCGEDLPEGAYYEELDRVPGRFPAYLVRHKRQSGRRCSGYAGPPCDEAGEADPPATVTAKRA